MQIIKIALLILLVTGAYAKSEKWEKLYSVVDRAYTLDDYHFKKPIKCLELRSYSIDPKTRKRTDNSFVTLVSVCSSSLSSRMLKRFRKIDPGLSKKGDIRRGKNPQDVINAMVIDGEGKMLRMNEITDLIDLMGEIDTPAEAQMVLWLNGENEAERCRRSSKGYEMIVEEHKFSGKNGYTEFVETYTFRVVVGREGKIRQKKMLKHGKKRAIEDTEEVVKKPAIYLYPLNKQRINVSLTINGSITTSIPAYRSGWSVLVDRNGTIENRYDYLFYENTLKKVELPREGWIKQGNVLDAWLDVILPKLGLNAKETEQFKAYWLKELDKDALYEIKLLSIPFLTQNMTLTIDPKPDTLIRVIFYFKPIQERYDLEEPVIVTPERSGFHVLEWGGMIEGER